MRGSSSLAERGFSRTAASNPRPGCPLDESAAEFKTMRAVELDRHRGLQEICADFQVTDLSIR